MMETALLTTSVLSVYGAGWAPGLGLTQVSDWRFGCHRCDLSTGHQSSPGTHRSGERDLIGACLRGSSLSCPPSRHVLPPTAMSPLKG